MLMGKEAFEDHKVVHLEDEANKAHCALSLSTQWVQNLCQKACGVGFCVAQLIERLPTMVKHWVKPQLQHTLGIVAYA